MANTRSLADEHRLSALMIAAREDASRETSQLMREAATWLRGYFRYRLPSDAREDLVQETLLILHDRRKTWDSARPFLPWLAGIARYRWLDHLREVYREKQRRCESVDIETLPDQVCQDHAQRTIAFASIDQLFARIPERQASAIRLVKLKGYSIGEAAHLTGQSESLVKVNIHRGMQRLTTLVAKSA